MYNVHWYVDKILYVYQDEKMMLVADGSFTSSFSTVCFFMAIRLRLYDSISIQWRMNGKHFFFCFCCCWLLSVRSTDGRYWWYLLFYDIFTGRCLTLHVWKDDMGNRENILYSNINMYTVYTLGIYSAGNLVDRNGKSCLLSVLLYL